MVDLGPPVAYTGLSPDAAIYDPSGEQVGHVATVLADEREDIFHGLLVRLPGIPDRYRFAEPDQISGLYERGATLGVDAGELHEPTEDSVAAAAVSDKPVRGEGLKRAWEWLNRHV
jgi:hypothetical protein